MCHGGAATSEPWLALRGEKSLCRREHPVHFRHSLVGLLACQAKAPHMMNPQCQCLSQRERRTSSTPTRHACTSAPHGSRVIRAPHTPSAPIGIGPPRRLQHGKMGTPGKPAAGGGGGRPLPGPGPPPRSLAPSPPPAKLVHTRAPPGRGRQKQQTVSDPDPAPPDYRRQQASHAGGGRIRVYCLYGCTAAAQLQLTPANAVAVAVVGPTAPRHRGRGRG